VEREVEEAKVSERCLQKLAKFIDDKREQFASEKPTLLA
jgi:hypothetical protein